MASSMSARDIISYGRVQLMDVMPFIADLCMYMIPQEVAVGSMRCPTMGVDQKGNLYYVKEFVELLGKEHIISVLSHETIHLAFLHPDRCCGREPALYNIAVDIKTNWLLNKNDIHLPAKLRLTKEQQKFFNMDKDEISFYVPDGNKIEIPLCGCGYDIIVDHLEIKSVEDIYADLEKQLPKIKKSSTGQGTGQCQKGKKQQQGQGQNGQGQQQQGQGQQPGGQGQPKNQPGNMPGGNNAGNGGAEIGRAHV